MATIVSRALMVLFLVLGLRVSRAESTESSATPEASKRPAFDNSKPQILIRRPFEKLNGVEYWSSGHPGYDCERNGVVMFGFVFFEGGTWHDAYGFSPSKQPYGDNFFMRMVDPSGKYHPAGEAVVKAIGSTEGRAVLFRDMECEPKPTGKWWQDYEVLISKPAWCSPSRPAASPPAVEELAGRMKREMAAEEEKERRECEQYPSLSADCDQEPYNPSKLAAPKLVEAAEFDIAPGETVFFVQLCREYPCKDSRASEEGYNSSNWCAILRKDGLELLWTASWVYLHDKMIQHYWPLGAADVDGDGVSEVIIVDGHYGGGDFMLYQYKPGDHKLSYEYANGDQM